MVTRTRGKAGSLICHHKTCGGLQGNMLVLNIRETQALNQRNYHFEHTIITLTFFIFVLRLLISSRSSLSYPNAAQSLHEIGMRLHLNFLLNG